MQWRANNTTLKFLSKFLDISHKFILLDFFSVYIFRFSRDESCVKEFNESRTKTNRLRAWNWLVFAPACVTLGVTTPAFATYETNVANIRDVPPLGASVPKRALIVLIRIALIVARASSPFHLLKRLIVNWRWMDEAELRYRSIKTSFFFPHYNSYLVARTCLLVYDVNSIAQDDT